MTPLAQSRVVLDTNLIVGAGSRWLASDPPQPASPLQRLVYWVALRHVGLYCREILDEYIELLLRQKSPPHRVSIFVAFIEELFTRIALTSTNCHTPPHDPDDVVFVLCALDGNADMLVSDDGHLLGIAPAYHPRPAILPSADAGVRLGVASPGAV